MLKKVRAEWKRNYLVYIVLIPVMVHFLIFQLIPFLANFLISLFRWDYMRPPVFIGIDNWVRAFQDKLFLESMINTGIFTLYFVLPVVAFGLVLALIIHSRKNRFSQIRGAYFLPVVTSFVVLAAIWKWLFASGDFGIINNVLRALGLPAQPFLNSSSHAMVVLALLSIFKCCGSYMIYYFAGLKNIPDSLYEAATVDGASGWRQFWHITLPMLRPTTCYILVLALTASFQVFDSAYLVTAGGPNNSTQTMVYQIYLNAFTGFNGGYAAAQSGILFFIIFLVTVLVRKIDKDITE